MRIVYLALSALLLFNLAALSQAAQQSTAQAPNRAEQTEQRGFLERKQRLESLPPGEERTTMLRDEVLRHQGELKTISLQRQAARQQVIDGLKSQWAKVDAEWKTETARHDAAKKRIEAMPDGPRKTAQMQSEMATHRAVSKEIAVSRHKVHEGVLKQANQEVMGGTAKASNAVKPTAGTSLTNPNHRGMNGDLDAGGGVRTTEKVAKILNEIGVKGPKGGPVKLTAGVVETTPEFGLTVNAAPGTDRIGSAGHQAQVKMGAAHPETYVSETGGAVRAGPLKDHLATLDHAKKASHGLSQDPKTLVGGAPEGQAMAKGALKAASQAGLSPETVSTIAKQAGLKNPESVLDTLAEIKAGRAPIASPEEAAKLQSISRDILNAAQQKSQAAAAAEVKQTQAEIKGLEAKGETAQAQAKRAELADYKAKAAASSEALASQSGSGAKGTYQPAAKSGGAKVAPVESEVKAASGSKLIKGAGLALGAYGIYEGYQTAKQEMEAKKQAEPTGILDSMKQKAELAAKTFWHGLGFSGMAEIGSQAGKDAYEQYQKDVAAGKVPKDSWSAYLAMKGKAVIGGLLGGAKALTYDAAKQSGTNLGTAAGEGLGVGKDMLGWLKNVRNEQSNNDALAKEVYDKLIKAGASPVGAQRAADGVRQGDFSEAKRLVKVLEAKKATHLAQTEPPSTTRSYYDRKKALAKKQAKMQTAQPKPEGEDDPAALRQTVIAKLSAKGLPQPASLVEQLVRVLERDGPAALDAAIAEIGDMQGTFAGSIGGRGRLSITVSGSNVTGTYSASASSGGYTATVRGSVTGHVDMTAGTVSMTMSGSVSAAGVKDPLTVTFNGRFTGQGYKGSCVGNGQQQSWSASRG